MQNCSEEVVRLVVVMSGYRYDKRNDSGVTPLHLAFARGRAPIVQMVLTGLSNPEAKHRYFEVPRKQIPLSGEILIPNTKGEILAHMAIERKDENHLQCQVVASQMMRFRSTDLYAMINGQRDSDGFTACHIAVDNDDKWGLRTLLRMGVDSSVRNFSGETAQEMAERLDRKRLSLQWELIRPLTRKSENSE